MANEDLDLDLDFDLPDSPDDLPDFDPDADPELVGESSTVKRIVLGALGVVLIVLAGAYVKRDSIARWYVGERIGRPKPPEPAFVPEKPKAKAKQILREDIKLNIVFGLDYSMSKISRELPNIKKQLIKLLQEGKVLGEGDTVVICGVDDGAKCSQPFSFNGDKPEATESVKEIEATGANSNLNKGVEQMCKLITNKEKGVVLLWTDGQDLERKGPKRSADCKARIIVPSRDLHGDAVRSMQGELALIGNGEVTVHIAETAEKYKRIIEQNIEAIRKMLQDEENKRVTKINKGIDKENAGILKRNKERLEQHKRDLDQYEKDLEKNKELDRKDKEALKREIEKIKQSIQKWILIIATILAAIAVAIPICEKLKPKTKGWFSVDGEPMPIGEVTEAKNVWLDDGVCIKVIPKSGDCHYQIVEDNRTTNKTAANYPRSGVLADGKMVLPGVKYTHKLNLDDL